MRKELTDSNDSPANTEMSQASHTASPPSQPTESLENSITKKVPCEDRGDRKFRKAVKAMCRILNPNRASQRCLYSTKTADEHADTPAHVGRLNQSQARHPSQQNNDLPGSPRNYPVRSAMRGSRPKKATDSSRRVRFAGEAVQPSRQKHEVSTSPRAYPLRSAMRGSRPKHATDSFRHVHFAAGTVERLYDDIDA